MGNNSILRPKSPANNQTYNDIIDGIKHDINKTQLDIITNANISLVNLYYRIGKVLYDNSVWGNKFLDKLAFELKTTYPNQKGFSVRNLKYMKTFYSEYKDDAEFVHLGAQLPWKHNVSLIEKVKTIKHNNFSLTLKQNSDLALYIDV